MSAMARRLRLAVAMTSSCRHELPAATALAVAIVMPFVIRMKSSGVETLAGGTGEEKTCEARGSGEAGGCGQAVWQGQHRGHTHRQLLANVLDRGLQRPCPLRGLVLDSLHRLQQGSDICHHHLWKEKDSQVNPHTSSGLLPAPVLPLWIGPKLSHPHTPLTLPQLLLCVLCSTFYVPLPTLLS